MEGKGYVKVKGKGIFKEKKKKMPGFTQTLTGREELWILSEWAAVCAGAAWLFYDSVWAFVLLFPGAVLWRKYRREAFRRRRKRRYAEEFAEGIRALASAICAGYSAEHAVYEAWKELRMIHPADNAMMEELHAMMVQVSMNQSVEQLFCELAHRSGLEDAESFSDVFSTAKRTGGNLVEIIEQAVRVLEEKEAVNREIEVLLAGKKYEQGIMSLIPFGMIAYIRAGSPGYLDVLYHNLPGICVMSLCLAVYGAALYMGSRVLQIEV